MSLDSGVGNKKKGAKAVYKMIIKRKKSHIAKRVNPKKTRSLNSFATQFVLKKGCKKAANVLLYKLTIANRPSRQ